MFSRPVFESQPVSRSFADYPILPRTGATPITTGSPLYGAATSSASSSSGFESASLGSTSMLPIVTPRFTRPTRPADLRFSVSNGDGVQMESKPTFQQPTFESAYAQPTSWVPALPNSTLMPYSSQPYYSTQPLQSSQSFDDFRSSSMADIQPRSVGRRHRVPSPDYGQEGLEATPRSSTFARGYGRQQSRSPLTTHFSFSYDEPNAKSAAYKQESAYEELAEAALSPPSSYVDPSNSIYPYSPDPYPSNEVYNRARSSSYSTEYEYGQQQIPQPGGVYWP